MLHPGSDASEPVREGAPPESPHARDDVVFRQLKDEWVILDPTVDRVHVLNLTAALVWTACDGRTRREAIVQDVFDAFEGRAERGAVADDVHAALERFEREGLLR